jgi:PPOX class probable F420-dependent enzyme
VWHGATVDDSKQIGRPAKLALVADRVLPDPTTPFGKRVQRRLRDEIVVWLTTTGADGTPQPNPVWFLWDGPSFLIYNRADAHRLTHVRTRPFVALNFDGNGRGGDIVVITGRAELPEGEPPSHDVPAYLAKYRESMTRVSGSPEAFSKRYPVAMRVWPVKVRGH